MYTISLNIAPRLSAVKELVWRFVLAVQCSSPQAQAALEIATIALIVSRASTVFEKD